MRRILFILVVLFSFGCSNASVKILKTAEVVDTLKMNTLVLSEELLMPTRLVASDGKLIIYQRKGEDVFIMLDISCGGNFEVIGKRGRGPNEFMSVDVQSLKPIDGGFMCMDAGGRVCKIKIADDVDVVKEQMSTFGHPQNGLILQDDFVAANLVSDEAEFVRYSRNVSEPRYFAEYPDWTDDDGQPLPFVYMKNMAAHPTRNLFAAFYAYFRKFRIFDADGCLKYDVDVRIPDEFPAYTSDASAATLAYASYPCATAKHVYALCRNSDIASMKESIPEIHVFDWNGNLQKRIIPDRHMDLFAVDEECGIVYGLDIEKANAVYYQYFDCE